MARSKNARDFFEVFRLPTNGKGKGEAQQGSEKEPEVDKPVPSGLGAPQAGAPEPAESPGPPKAAEAPVPRFEVGGALSMEQEDISAEGRRSGLGGVLVTKPGRIIITLSTPAFAAGVLVLVLFIVLSFAAGHWQGSRVASADKAVKKEPKTTVAVVERAAPPLPAPAPKKGRETGIWRREVAQAPGNAPRPVREPMTTPRVTPSPVAPAPGPPEPTVRTPYYALQVIAGINPNKAEKLRAELEQEGYQNVVVKQEGKGATVFLGRFDSKEASEAKQYLKVIKEKKFEGKPQFKDCYIVKVE